ncbi:hypothetical protein HQQ94_02560 [Shewanella sp. VB17]|nr:hypothetical protein [Shewanella sp. VB17]
MSIQFVPYRYRLGFITPFPASLLLIILMISSTSLYAKTQDQLPLGVVLDSQGNPISLPSKQQSALELPSLKLPKKIPQPSHKKKTSILKPRNKPFTHKQFTRRNSVANDPGCRWLNSRMTQLESKISLLNDHSKSHHNKELAIRQNEWKCMKCGKKGPNQSDRSKCQHRR